MNAIGVDYLRYNVKGRPELMAEVKRQGFKTLPAVVSNGQVIEGWDEVKLRTIL